MNPDLPRYLQLLWTGSEPPRRGPKPGASIEQIGRAGVQIATESGVDAVSMKSVADSLGMTPMSLYRYIDSKDELLDLMLHFGYGPPDPTLTESGSWSERLTRWAMGLVDVLVANDWMMMSQAPNASLTPNVVRWAECGLVSLANTNLDAQEKLSSLLLVDGFVRHHVRQSIMLGALPRRPTPKAASHRPPYGETMLKVIDPEKFPQLTSTSARLSDDSDDFFDTELAYGLGVILDGLERRIDRKNSR